MVGLNRFGLSYLGPVVLLLPNTLDYLAFQSYLLILSAPDEGYYVPDEGYYVPDEGYYVPDEGYYEPDEGYSRNA
jgi:hypothetical protein